MSLKFSGITTGFCMIFGMWAAMLLNRNPRFKEYFTNSFIVGIMAAMVDGTTFFGAFRRVTLPLAAPGIAAAAIVTFILCWNEFLYALMLTGKYAKTAPVAIASYNTYEGVFGAA